MTDFQSLYSDAVDEALAAEEFVRVLAESPQLDRDQLHADAKLDEDHARRIVRSELSQLERAQGRLVKSEHLIAGAGGRALRRAAAAGALLAVVVPMIALAQSAVALAGGGQTVFGWLADSVGILLTPLLSALTPLALLLPLLIRDRLQRQMAEELDIEVARIDYDTALARLQQGLLDGAVKPKLRAMVNDQIEASWSTEFAVRAAPGLRELADPSFEVSTRAREGLAALLASRGSGSIGVAGPRGAGKTTLINALAKLDDGAAEGESIGLVLSAPVRYEPRDFLLHLFASLAERVVGEDAAARDQVDAIADFKRRNRRQLAQLMLLLAGIFLILAFVTWIGGTTDLGLTVAEQAAVAFLSLSVAAAFAYAFLISSSVMDAPPSARVRYAAIAQSLGPAAPLANAALEILQALFRDRRLPGEGDGRPDDPSLAWIALRELRSIRFQQTFSSGWSGSLKLPAGAGLGADATLSLAQSQMTLPEVTARFVAFAGKVAEERPVVIGLDELDKMESEEAARQFINDVKSVFGITGCFYLISVSEDAMSGFDRRGMPFRDVFDSSLDEVFYVPYLGLDEGALLLRSRIIGLSWPFQCLCFVLSGGLARDLVRVARQLVACHDRSGDTALSALGARVLERDVASKQRASMVAAQRTESHVCVGLLTGWLRKGKLTGLSPPLLEERIAAFQDEVSDRLPVRDEEGGDRHDPAAAVRRIGSELIGYYYFAGTVLAVFDELPDAESLGEAIDDGRIDRLARARQDLAISPLAAWTTLSDLRAETAGLRALAPPDVLLA